jgi:anaerobic selenocysteine-containing dehydrogenase
LLSREVGDAMMSSAPEGEVRSYCRLCSAICGVIVEVRGGRVVESAATGIVVPARGHVEVSQPVR